MWKYTQPHSWLRKEKTQATIPALGPVSAGYSKSCSCSAWHLTRTHGPTAATPALHAAHSIGLFTYDSFLPGDSLSQLKGFRFSTGWKASSGQAGSQPHSLLTHSISVPYQEAHILRKQILAGTSGAFSSPPHTVPECPHHLHLPRSWPLRAARLLEATDAERPGRTSWGYIWSQTVLCCPFRDPPELTKIPITSCNHIHKLPQEQKLLERKNSPLKSCREPEGTW